MNIVKPLRIVAAVLLLVVGVEVWGITHTPTYEVELANAKAAYEAALKEYRELKTAADAAATGW